MTWKRFVSLRERYRSHSRQTTSSCATNVASEPSPRWGDREAAVGGAPWVLPEAGSTPPR